VDENIDGDPYNYLPVKVTVANKTKLAAVGNNSENPVIDTQHVD
jgi:hypothetical protein